MPGGRVGGTVAGLIGAGFFAWLWGAAGSLARGMWGALKPPPPRRR
jgi:hypothetical protein